MVRTDRRILRDQALRQRMAATESLEDHTRIALEHLRSAMVYARAHRIVSHGELDALAHEVIDYLLDRAGMVESATPDAPPSAPQGGYTEGRTGAHPYPRARERSV